jgi:anti-sigma B factor antagonist
MSEHIAVAPRISVAADRRREVTVVRVRGEVDMRTCDEVRGAVATCLAEPIEVLVLDLTGVTFFGSVGLAVLIDARQRAEQRGIRFAVAADRRAVLRPLTETGVAGLIALRANVPDATEAARVHLVP